MSSYLNELKQSIVINNRRLQTEVNFRGSGYTGFETIGEILLSEGIQFEEDLLSEGFLSVPFNKMKSMVFTLGKDIGSMEGLKNIKKKFGGIASRVNVGFLKKKAIQLAASKNIDEKEIDSMFEIVARALSAVSFATIALSQPLGWLLILVALLKSGDLQTFKKNMKTAVEDLVKSVTVQGTNYEQAMSLYAYAYKLVLICFIPPWIQASVLLPIAGILGFVALVMVAIEFLNYFGKDK